MIYYFDVEKYKVCPYIERCYKEGSKKKSYSETLICDRHSEQTEFQEKRNILRKNQKNDIK